MYNFFLYTHSYLRWIVLILAVIVLAQSFMGWFGDKTYAKRDNALSASFVGTMHLQLLIGLLLYFVWSPFGLQAFQSMGSAVMKDSAVRYWAVEHISIMIIAIAIAQIGRSRAKKAAADKAKWKTQAIFFGIAVVLMLSRIPWGEAGRLFRGF
ncbi:MAG: hypothetical protein AAFR61_03325 [Bacteroidota bacterium]